MVAQQSSANPPVRVTVWRKLKFCLWFLVVLVPIAVACCVSSESLPKPRVPVYWSERGQFPETNPLSLIFRCPTTTLTKIHPQPSATHRLSWWVFCLIIKKMLTFLRFQQCLSPPSSHTELQQHYSRRQLAKGDEPSFTSAAWAQLSQLFEPNSWRLCKALEYSMYNSACISRFQSLPKAQHKVNVTRVDMCWHVLTSRLESRYFELSASHPMPRFEKQVQSHKLPFLRHDRNPPENYDLDIFPLKRIASTAAYKKTKCLACLFSKRTKFVIRYPPRRRISLCWRRFYGSLLWNSRNNRKTHYEQPLP